MSTLIKFYVFLSDNFSLLGDEREGTKGAYARAYVLCECQVLRVSVSLSVSQSVCLSACISMVIDLEVKGEEEEEEKEEERASFLSSPVSPCFSCLCSLGPRGVSSPQPSPPPSFIVGRERGGKKRAQGIGFCERE